MRVLIASDKFKGSLTAPEACEAIRQGLASGFDEAGSDTFVIAPVADGGDGMARAITSGKKGSWVETTVSDAIGRPVEAGFGWIESESLAVIEMAEASGLWRLEPEDRDPWNASTRGTGELIRHAIELGAGQILLGIGGSATNDGGTGLAAALGIRFLDEAGNEITDLPAGLERAVAIDRDPAGALPSVTVACDVTNPLLGKNGCTRVYGPQKGIEPGDFDRHEQRLRHLITLTGEPGLAGVPGAGAAGGLGFGCLAFLEAELRPGFELVAEILGLDAAVANADLVITGEGKLDRQTLQGKAPAGVAALARKHGKPVVAFGGLIDPEAVESLASAFDAIYQIAPSDLDPSESMARGAEFLRLVAGASADAIRSQLTAGRG